MQLPKLTDLDLEGKKVLVRLDLDVPDDDDTRLEEALSTLTYLAKKNCKVVVIGHKGRPKGKEESLSLEPVSQRLQKLLTKELGEEGMEKLSMNMMENLRFDPGEKANDQHYAEHLAEHGEFYVNEAFGVSHRKHASVFGLPSLTKYKGKKAAGFQFAKEVDTLSAVLESPKRPLVFILGGAKEDKLKYFPPLTKIADKILIGGRLPEYLGENYDGEGKMIAANLLPDKEDITIHSIEEFGVEIAKAATIVLAGPMGKFEEDGHMQGTKRVFEAVANSSALKIAAGGDTEAVITILGLNSKFDWISVGGGACLDFLANGILPGISALLSE